MHSLDELLDGLVQFLDGLEVVVLHRVHNAVGDVVVKDHLARIVDGRLDRRYPDRFVWRYAV